MTVRLSEVQYRRLVELIRNVYTDATMDRSAFDHIWAERDDPLPLEEKEVTAFIRRRTDLWRRTWILAPLKEVLGILQISENKE